MILPRRLLHPRWARLCAQANAMLGNWGAAYKDLTQAQQLDFDDEQIFEWMPNVKKNGIAMQVCTVCTQGTVRRWHTGQCGVACVSTAPQPGDFLLTLVCP